MKDIELNDTLRQRMERFEAENTRLTRLMLEQNNEIATLRKTKNDYSTFVSLVTHELRSPLSSMSGLVDLALEDNEEDRTDKLQMMKDLIKGMDLFTEEIGGFFRSQGNSSNFESINWSHLFEYAVNTYGFLAGNDKIKIQLNTSEARPVYSDGLRIKVLINNLISNAIKYRRPNTDLTISVSLLTNEKRTILEISDNGTGIAPEKLGRIFDMFYRATDSVKGLGLGLFIVKEIVNTLDGSIEVKSEYGKGTTFTIIFPNKENHVQRSSGQHLVISN